MSPARGMFVSQPPALVKHVLIQKGRTITITTMKIEDVLVRLKSEMTIILVTNLVQQARRLADRVAFFNASQLIEAGETEAMFGENPSSQLTFDYVRGHFG